MRFPLRWGSILGVGVTLGTLGAAAACGSKTGLVLDDGLEGDGSDETFTRHDTGRDAPLPPIDVAPKPDVNRNDCPDAAATLIYVITKEYDLFSFNPPTGAFGRIGAIRCPNTAADDKPFSMAVDRKGVAFVLFDSGQIFRVSNVSAACTATPFVPGAAGFLKFGMGFASDSTGPAESLYVASDEQSSTGTGAPSRIGKIDMTKFVLTSIGVFDDRVTNAELTGTGDGRLFAFYSTGPNLQTSPTAIGEVDKTTGRLIAQTPLPTVRLGGHWAFGFWGGDFYTFTGLISAGTDVTRVRPSDGSVVVVGHLGEDIVGAGVSTCAPEN